MILCMSAIPRIIYISKKKRILDQPDNNRKVHKEVIPNLGGIAIFLGIITIASLFINSTQFPKWNYIVAAIMILFVTGAKDDIINVNPAKKLLAQVTAGFFVSVLADIRLENLHGLLGIYELPYSLSIVISILGYAFVSNAFNLIDGVDGLAGTISLLSCFILGIFFAFGSYYSEAIICFTLAGSIAGFLRYNLSPAKIFMGDSGSLVIGFVLSVIAVLFTNATNFIEQTSFITLHKTSSLIIVALTVLILPIFDTFRVFILRILKKKSPFSADRTHLHHYLLDLGFSHTKVVITMICANILLIIIALASLSLNINLSIAIILFAAGTLCCTLYFAHKRKLSDAINTKVKKHNDLVF